jgi:site-specific recombinase XerC
LPQSGCFNFLVIRQIVPANPTASVRGPKYIVKRGKTPVWSRADAKKLLESIPRNDLAGLRDRARISTMLFSFARVSAVLALKRRDFFYQAPRRWLRFHEKGGKEHEMPAHHQIEEALDEYLSAVSIDDNGPLFQSVTETGSALTGRSLDRSSLGRDPKKSQTSRLSDACRLSYLARHRRDGVPRKRW